MPDRLRRRTLPDHDPLQGLHPVLARALAARGVVDAADLQHGLDRLLPPSGLEGSEQAARLLADALADGDSILVVGDFDADGATSAALAVSLLRELGAARVDFLVPNRFDFGYGLTPEIVEVAADWRPDLIVTVDNGISSQAGVERAAGLGIRTLVTDHHLPPETLPAADVIVNPNLAGCQFPSKHLAGVGVIFYVMLALRAELRRRDWFDEAGRSEPKLAGLLDLVALGTVADVVPLDRNNRVLVQQGLMRIRAGECRPGIRALLQVAGREPSRATAADLAFAVGPRLNAAGRLDDMSAGIECLLTTDEHRARELAGQLDELNRSRQAIERDMQAQALEILDELHPEQDTLPAGLCLYQADWHQGVVGILASRIKDRVHRPVIAFARSEEGALKGSARSIPGVHIRDVLERINSRCPGLVQKFGGHAMAAGLSLAETDLADFERAFDQAVSEWLGGSLPTQVLETDGELAPADLELGLARELRYAVPWGQHFPEPLFDGVFRVVQQRLVGERHLKLVLQHPEDASQVLDAIAFNIDTSAWPCDGCEQVRTAYRLDCNYFRGREQLQLAIEYLEIC